MQCRSCANPLQDVGKFCDNCGVVLAVVQKKEESLGFLCFHCGTPLRGKKNYCVACGFKVERKVEQAGLLYRVKKVLSRPQVQFLIAAFLFTFFVAPILFMLAVSPSTPSDGYQIASSAYLISTLAGPGSEANGVEMRSLNGVAMDQKGNLYVADPDRHQVLKMDTNRVVRVFAGTGKEGFAGDNGQAYAAQLSRPSGLAIDAAGYVYIADTGNHRIRRVSPDGKIQTIAGSGPAGEGNGDYAGDGLLATMARLDSPTAVFTDATGNVYFSDAGNLRLRKLRPLSSDEPTN